MSLTNCTHEGNGLVDKTFGIANTLAVFVNEILKGIGFSNPALFIPHCRLMKHSGELLLHYQKHGI